MVTFRGWVPVRGRILVECEVSDGDPESFEIQNKVATHLSDEALERGILMEELISGYKFDSIGKANDIELESVVDINLSEKDEIFVDPIDDPEIRFDSADDHDSYTVGILDNIGSGKDSERSESFVGRLI